MRFLGRTLACVLTGAALSLLSLGCTSYKKDTKTTATTSKEGKKHAHAHPDEGPHGGALVEWGNEEYHAEFTVDHDAKKATVYILDDTAKKTTPIEAESIMLTITNVKPNVQLELKADPQPDDPKGKASRFSGTHEKLATVMEFNGEISGKVGDTPYSGSFAEKKHTHEKKKE